MITKSPAEVEAFYKDHICPDLLPLEAKRIRSLRKVIALKTSSLVLLIILMVIVGYFAPGFLFLCFFAALGIYIAIDSALHNYAIVDLNKEYQPYVRKVWEFAIPELDYESLGSISLEDLEASNLLFDKLISVKSAGYGSGELNHIQYESCNLESYKSFENEQIHETKTFIFVFSAKLPIENTINIIIKPKSDNYITIKELKTEGYNLVNGKDSFYQCFDFITNNQSVAAELITEEVIQVLNNFAQRKPVLSLQENRLYIRIANKSSFFETRLSKSFLDPKRATKSIALFNHAFELCNLIVQNAQKSKLIY